MTVDTLADLPADELPHDTSSRDTDVAADLPPNPDGMVDLRPLAFDPTRDDVPVPPAKLENLGEATRGTVAGRLIRDGIRLFAWRSWIPLLLLLPGLFALQQRTRSGVLFPSIGADGWLVVAAAVCALGELIRITTVGVAPANTSGRNLNHLRAATLNTTGWYSVVRNPLYLGNLLIILGFALAFRVAWFAGLVGVLYWLYIDRIIAVEEHYLGLRFGDQFQRWARTTPPLIPALRRPTATELNFCWRTALRREYNGIFLMITFFVLARTLEARWGPGSEWASWSNGAGPIWWSTWFGALSTFCGLRWLKKRTRLLHVADR